MIGIYRIVNQLDGKCYIGQSDCMEKRFKNHKVAWRKNKSTSPLYYAVQKDGIENFSFEVLEECDVDELDEREAFYICKFNSTNPQFGYNRRNGGGCADSETRTKRKERLSASKTGKQIAPPSKETLERRSATLKGMPKSDEWRGKMSEIMKGREITPEWREKISNSLKGNTIPPEVREKLRIASTGRVQTEAARQKISQKVSKKVCQLDSDGNVLAIYENARAASAATGTGFPNISSCCNGKRAKAGGFGWKFYEETE